MVHLHDGERTPMVARFDAWFLVCGLGLCSADEANHSAVLLLARLNRIAWGSTSTAYAPRLGVADPGGVRIALIAGTMQAAATWAWYWRNWHATVLYVMTFTRGPVAAIWGKEDTFVRALI